jgi:hypothetical protein
MNGASSMANDLSVHRIAGVGASYMTLDECRRADSLAFRVDAIDVERDATSRRWFLRLSRTQAGELYHRIGEMLFDDEKARR